MNGLKTTILVAIIVTISLALGYLKPSISSYIAISQATVTVDKLMIDGSQPSCLQPIMEDNESQAKLKDALSKVEQALQKDPSNQLALRLSGQIYCLMGNYQNAVRSFNHYLSRREKDPLVHLEAGLADLHRCCNLDKQFGENCEVAAEHLQKARISTEELLDSGMSAYWNQKYQISNNFLAWNICLTGKSDPPTDLMLAVSSIMTKDTHNIPTQILNEHSIQIKDNTIIQEDHLYWLRSGEKYGMPIHQVPIQDATAGAIWTGGPVGVIINISDPGQYAIKIRALDKQPSPIKLRIEHNYSLIQQFELSKGDNSWSEITTMVDLDKGYHIITVDFLNDGIANGVDRNLYIDWIGIQISQRFPT